MPLLEATQQQHYGQQSFTATASQTDYTLTFPECSTLMNGMPTMPTASGQIRVDTIVSGVTSTGVSHSFNATTNVVTIAAQAAGTTVIVNIIDPDLGNYQYISMQQLVNNFIIGYVGEEKMIQKVKRADIYFHASRGLQEFSYDTLRAEKSQEIEIPPSLKMALPHDYVNYVKISWSGDDGIERIIYPAAKTTNPTALLQDGDYGYTYDSDGNLLTASDSDRWANYSDGVLRDQAEDAETQIFYNDGGRYGLDPLHANANGKFFIDHVQGNIHFSSDLNGRTITLKYITDNLGTEADMVIHKLAEEAMYKWIAHAILASRINIPEYLVQRLKKERFAEMRKAKLRLQNIKLEELTQWMRGKSKQIKH